MRRYLRNTLHCTFWVTMNNHVAPQSDVAKAHKTPAHTCDAWGAEGKALCWYGPAPLVPIAPICCVEGFTLADINELDVEEMRTVLGLLLSCWDCPNGPCGVCSKEGVKRFMQSSDQHKSIKCFKLKFKLIFLERANDYNNYYYSRFWKVLTTAHYT